MKWKTDAIYFKQERRIIDGVPGGAHELHNEFLNKIKKEFTKEEYEKFVGTFLEIKHLEHVSQDIVSAFRAREQSTLDGDTETIEITIDDQLVGLLYQRRTDLNNAEVTYFIFQEKLQKLKKDILKDIKK